MPNERVETKDIQIYDERSKQWVDFGAVADIVLTSEPMFNFESGECIGIHNALELDMSLKDIRRLYSSIVYGHIRATNNWRKLHGLTMWRK